MIALGYAVVFISIFLNDVWVDTAQLQMLITPSLPSQYNYIMIL